MPCCSSFHGRSILSSSSASFFIPFHGCSVSAADLTALFRCMVCLVHHSLSISFVRADERESAEPPPGHAGRAFKNRRLIRLAASSSSEGCLKKRMFSLHQISELIVCFLRILVSSHIRLGLCVLAFSPLDPAIPVLRSRFIFLSCVISSRILFCPVMCCAMLCCLLRAALLFICVSLLPLQLRFLVCFLGVGGSAHPGETCDTRPDTKAAFVSCLMFGCSLSRMRAALS